MKKVIVFVILAFSVLMVLLITIVLPKGTDALLDSFRGPTITEKQFSTVEIGDSQKTVVEKLGDPVGERNEGNKNCAFYINQEIGQKPYLICFKRGIVVSKEIFASNIPTPGSSATN